MLTAILKTLGFDIDASDAGEGDALGKVASALEAMPPAEARYVAAFAYLLSRVAFADHDLAESERKAMERLIAERAALDPAQARLVIDLATAQSMAVRGTEDFLVSREFARTATAAQKRALIDCLFAVSASDDSIITAEDNEIRRIASEIGIEHAEFVAIRHRYREHLAVLRKPTDPSPAS